MTGWYIDLLYTDYENIDRWFNVSDCESIFCKIKVKRDRILWDSTESLLFELGACSLTQS